MIGNLQFLRRPATITETFFKTLGVELTYHVSLKTEMMHAKRYSVILNYFIVGNDYTALLIIVHLRSMNVLKRCKQLK